MKATTLFKTAIITSCLAVSAAQFINPPAAYADVTSDVCAAAAAGAEGADAAGKGLNPYDDAGKLELRVSAFQAGTPAMAFSFAWDYTENYSDTLRVNFLYDLGYGSAAGRNASYWSKIASIVAAAPKDDDVECLAYLHDALCDTASYNRAAAAKANDTGDAGYYRYTSAASALLDGNTICTGYAKAMMDLAQAAGFDAYLAHSASHMWTMVNVHGEWLAIDATRDDSNNTHKYFLTRTDGSMAYPQLTSRQSAPESAEQPSAAPAAESAPAPASETVNAADEVYTSSPAPADKEEKKPVAPQHGIRYVARHVGMALVPSWTAMAKSNNTIYSALTEGETTRFESTPTITLYEKQLTFKAAEEA